MTTGEEWGNAWWPDWYSKSTPPYTVVAVELAMEPPPGRPGKCVFFVYYRSFKKAVRNQVLATDELGAFVEAQKLMATLRAKSEKHRNQLR
jgi:hypothetical protein